MAGTNSTRTSAFNPKVVFGLILFGAIAFIATLYFIGAGNTGRDTNNGGGHGAGKGLNGYAALASLLEEEGMNVSLSRSQGRLDDEGLLVLTPPSSADPEELAKAINNRRYVGPTLVVLPKWMVFQVPATFDSDIQDGWVKLFDTAAPDWADELDYQLSPEMRTKNTGWTGMGTEGVLPEPDKVMGTRSSQLIPLVKTQDGVTLAGYVDDDGYYPVLSQAAGRDTESSDNLDSSKWNVTFVIEPDLLNNYGFADEKRADLAYDLVGVAMEGEDLPVIFDLTMNGLGTSQNLLTLAFTAPFLAATLCLILAMIVIAWRAFRRFGPPAAEARSIAFGKARLVKNSAGFIQRSKRLHLLSSPYADMVRERVVRALALRKPDDEAIDNALAKRIPDAGPFSVSADALRAAKSPHDILRAAAALKSIERMLSK